MMATEIIKELTTVRKTIYITGAWVGKRESEHRETRRQYLQVLREIKNLK